MDFATLDQFIETERAAGTIPGGAVQVSKGGKVLHTFQTGVYCGLKGRALPLTDSVRHPLYSYSKLISATVIATLRQEGKLDYDTPVASWFPEFAGGGKGKITLRHLMTHAAGIPGVPLGGALTESAWQEGWRAACAASVEWEPGSRTAYHALSGLFVAAHVVRQIEGGESWDTICRKRLFGPLGAATLTFALPPEDAPVALTPQPRGELPKTLREHFGMAGQPAGGCLGTVDDAWKVLQLHLNRGLWKGRRLLSQAAWSEIHTLQWRREIDAARAAGREPSHETWGLGPLLRGWGPDNGGHAWFGFGSQKAPGVFGHAGIDTVIGVGEPDSGAGVFFVSTASPTPDYKTVVLRGGVTDRAFAAVG